MNCFRWGSAAHEREPMARYIPVPDPASLQQLLESHGIPYHTWQGNKVKSLDTLFEEASLGETRFLAHATFPLLRHVDRSQVHITYDHPAHGPLVLWEDRQEFADGTVRERNHKKVREKQRPGESSLETIVRGIAEELGIHLKDASCLVRVGDRKTTYVNSTGSYPGLPSRYRTTRFKWRMTSAHFKPEGYQEVRPNRITYFVWRSY